MPNSRPDESTSTTSPATPATPPTREQEAADAPKPRWRPGEVTHQVIDAARAEDRAPLRQAEPPTPAPGEPDPGDTRDTRDTGETGDTTSGDGEPEAVKRGRGRPRTRSVDEERAMILAAARSSFGELGFNGASIDDIAKRSGIQRRSVYRQFADKEELFQAAMASAIDHVLGQLSKAFARNETLDPEEALFRNYRRALEMVATDPSWSLVFLSSMSTTSELSTAAVVEGRRRLEAGIAASLRYRWELLGVDRPERADQLATMIVGLVMTMGTRMSLEPDLAIDDVARLLTSFTIGGVIWIEAGH